MKNMKRISLLEAKSRMAGAKQIISLKDQCRIKGGGGEEEKDIVIVEDLVGG